MLAPEAATVKLASWWGRTPGSPSTSWRVTSALQARIQQHRLGIFEGFSKTYGCKVLVWYENHPTRLEAIQREKRIKRWRREWKLALIEAENPQWRDLSEEGFEAPEGPLSWMQRP